MRTNQKKIVAYLALPFFLLMSSFASAYEPPRSPDLFEKGKTSSNLATRNHSGFLFDLTGSMGVSTDFKRDAALAASGRVGLGYRLVLNSWDLWDFSLELLSGMGGSEGSQVFYPIGAFFRFGYGVPLNHGLNFLSQVGFGGTLTSLFEDQSKSKFLPGGFLGFQFEFLATRSFRIVVGPRISIQSGLKEASSNSVVAYYVPELLAGFRFKL